MNNECVHCGCDDIEASSTRRGKPDAWRCVTCGRGGVFTRAINRQGRVFTVRVEVQRGKPELRKPWVPAESLTYEERVA